MRGHHDSVTDLERDDSGSDNHGNFLALLNFRIEAGDTVLGEHLSTAARNATYISNSPESNHRCIGGPNQTEDYTKHTSCQVVYSHC